MHARLRSREMRKKFKCHDIASVLLPCHTFAGNLHNLLAYGLLPPHSGKVKTHSAVSPLNNVGLIRTSHWSCVLPVTNNVAAKERCYAQNFLIELHWHAFLHEEVSYLTRLGSLHHTSMCSQLLQQLTGAGIAHI
jgi:hypothetical protein